MYAEKDEKCDMLLAMTNELTSYLIAALDTKSWSQRELARKAGLSTTAINQIVNETARPTADTIVKLAHALGVDPIRMLRLAGILPDVPALTEQQEALYQMIGQITSPTDYDTLFRLVAGLAQSAGPLPGSERPTNQAAHRPPPRCPDCPLHDELSREQRLDALRRMLAQFGEGYYPAFLRLVTEQLEEQQREDALLRNGNERPTDRPQPGNNQPGRADNVDPTTENHAAASGAVRGNY